MTAGVRIRLGGIYWDGKDGVRHLVPPPTGATARVGHVFYTVLAGPERNSASRLVMPLSCTKESMAHWAACEIHDNDLSAVLDAIRASSLRLTTAQQQFLLETFEKSIRRRPSTVEVVGEEGLRLAKRLASMDLIMSSTDDDDKPISRAHFTLTPFGIQVIRARRGENVVATVLPRPVCSGKTPPNFVRRARAAM
jgi:hypothetical protein